MTEKNDWRLTGHEDYLNDNYLFVDISNKYSLKRMYKSIVSGILTKIVGYGTFVVDEN